MSTSAVLLAAGSGRRFKKKNPKQWALLNGEPLFLKSLRVFTRVPSVKEIVLVVNPRQEKKYKSLLKRKKYLRNVHVVAGGGFRGQSVKNGFRALRNPTSVVLIHDTARPLVTREIVRRVETAARRFGAALAAWPVGDTLKKSRKNDFVKKTVSRQSLWAAQTPQGFRWDWAVRVLGSPSTTATDDVELVERRGGKVKIVLGSSQNIKVTYPSDLKICQSLLKN